MARDYVHGYDSAANRRLEDQAETLEELLHRDTAYPAGSAVLEAGCGVGAQTGRLLRRNPEIALTCIDISASSLAEARARLSVADLARVRFERADLYALPFPDGRFDHVFVCFVLEHLARPLAALAELMRVLKPGGTMTVIEGDHGSTYFHPDDADARRAVECQVELQRAAGGDALIGRRLYPLLEAAGFPEIRVSARMVYVDGSKPALRDGFVRKTFTAMIEGVRGPALAAGLTTPEAFDRGIRALYRTAEADGTFCYAFFKAVAVRG
jgi:SAM-dependent methyltransferase